jgi:hypothetical protein
MLIPFSELSVKGACNALRNDIGTNNLAAWTEANKDTPIMQHHNNNKKKRKQSLCENKKKTT